MASPTPRTYRLANGKQIVCDSTANAKLLDDEIFQRKLYAEHGIVLNNGDCIFDVGANIGCFLLMLNECLGDARVFCFEPLPDTFGLLKQNSQHHNHLTTQLFNCGLSSQVGVARFTYFPLSSVNSTMHPRDAREFHRESREFILEEISQCRAVLKRAVRSTPGWIWFPITESIRRYYQRSELIECQLQTLANIIDEYGVERIDLLKIDTEGAEQSILAGLRESDWPIIQQVVVEVHDGPAGGTAVTDLLESHGFRTSTGKPQDQIDRLSMVYATRSTTA
ncbi:FkbM family methyltransferase [Aureliella helgolandensis]|uniref:31-O-demethyl-FK506 methyltransferase FkbM n=1 Tax=Aureliella helgolandensis TaxID=2527968 RepID=A0A518G2A3_9BACT|nr:FkbM family methyltransferase [Aureliella helgolandensis]QDV22675.1 31-O-demethyl-FK506 methyltransferase FkbM [Aureliella helgolandensis]